MNEPQIRERDLLDMLLETLRELPQVHTQEPLPERRIGDYRQIDAEICLDAAGTALTLLIELRKSVYPRDVRQVLSQIKQFGMHQQLADQGNAAVPILVAESISPGAKELLRRESVGYFDTGGSLFIPAHGAFFYIEKPAPKALKKSVRSLFRGKRGQVIHALLIRPGDWLGVNELADLARVSSATASETLRSLERFDWIESQGRGPFKERRLAEPGALLDEWSRQTPDRFPRPERRFFVPSIDAEELMERLSRLCDEQDVECAITQEAAAQRYSPFLSAISRVACRMLPCRAADRALSELNARIVSEGANLSVIETESQGEFLFKERTGGVWLASPVQVYLDLLRGGGRSKEMAENLRRERIGF